MDVQDPSRQTWGRQIEFLFVVVGQGVGFGNVWRFPYICYKNGGGVFFIPYVTAIFLLGIPGAFLEGSLGQFTSRGVISCFKIVPLFQGVGHMIAMLGYLTMCYYSVLFAWVLYYLFASMQSELPWSHCNNTWNTQACRVITATKDNQTWGPSTTVGRNISETGNRTFMDPATEFWERGVLALSSGVDHPGNVKWDLALCLLLAWILIYFCIWKGVRWIGKISYVTATLPYLLLLTLLVYGVTLEGSANGIKFYLLPDWSKLAEPKIWLDACIQVFFSYAIGIAIHTSLGSNNVFRTNILKHYFLFAIINSGTSFLCGFVIFSVLGFMAKSQGLSIDEVAESGPGLAFIVYPQAISQMPVPQLWAVLFFLMLAFIAIDSEGGVYVEQIFEWYCGGKLMFIAVFLECVVIAYGYAYGYGNCLECVASTYGYGKYLECVIISYGYGKFLESVVITYGYAYGYGQFLECVIIAYGYGQFLECVVIAYGYGKFLECAVIAYGYGKYLECAIIAYGHGKFLECVVIAYGHGKFLRCVVIAYGYGEFLEGVVIAYGYGSSRFQRNLEYMLGYRIGPFFKYVWLFVTPAICLILLVTDIVLYPIQTYKMKSGIYRFPPGTKARFRQLLRPEFTTTQQQRDRGVHGKDLGEPECLALNTKSENH
ncbi:sodium- and chloride-dependent GABA transporter 2-like [Liolophura sinensis]|uniref:sodium- and chloride-dependent GABA transporter 2-like n=1 Tax=Liolophura sinensis TaxID=3198878 RepID=UPI00315936F9